MTTSRKIRVYPKNKKLYKAALDTYRRAYNLTIDSFKNKNIKPSSDLRKEITEQCKNENHQIYDVNLIGEAYRKACSTRNAVLSKRKKEMKADYHFMSWKYSPKYFVVNRLGVNGSVYNKSLGSVFYTESIPKEAIGKNAIVTYKHDQWFISVKKEQMIKPTKTKSNKIIALDPGVRTFITSYSENETIKYGDKFVKNKLFSLMVQISKLISARTKYLNILKKTSNDFIPQWITDRLANIDRRINSVKAKQNNLINDLHRRVAYDIVINNDIILLPTFETKQMVAKKKGKKGEKGKKSKRKIRKSVARSMLALAHYRFKTYIKWLAKKYGKVVIDVDESYTSKTLWNGSLKHNLSGQETIKYKGIVVDRDEHGARNIFIKFFTENFKGVFITPSVA